MRKLILACLVLTVTVAHSQDWRTLLSSLEIERQHIMSSLSSIEASYGEVSKELKKIEIEYENLRQLNEKQAELYENKIKALQDLKARLTQEIVDLERALQESNEREKRLKESAQSLPELEQSLSDLKKQVQNDKIVLKISLGVLSSGLAAASIAHFATNQPLLGIIELALAVGGGIMIVCVK